MPDCDQELKRFGVVSANNYAKLFRESGHLSRIPNDGVVMTWLRRQLEEDARRIPEIAHDVGEAAWSPPSVIPMATCSGCCRIAEARTHSRAWRRNGIKHRLTKDKNV